MRSRSRENTSIAGFAVVVDVEDVLIVVFFVLGEHHDARAVGSHALLLIGRDEGGEVESLASAIGYVVGTAEVGQVGLERVADNGHLISIVYAAHGATQRLHVVHLDGVSASGEQRFHLLCRERAPLGLGEPVVGGGTGCQQQDGDDGQQCL